MSATEVAPRLAIVKLGGSVLTGLEAYQQAASFLKREGGDGAWRIVAVVSAEYGHTDALAREASELAATPDPAALDLLWSTGELRSVALLTLALRAAGVSAVGLNAHEAGLRSASLDRRGPLHPASEAVEFGGLALRAALARHAVVVVPGFLATKFQQIVTLGRGGSDLSAVLLAEALGADRCILIKDVDGYFTSDPATHNDATPIASLTYTHALAMADANCPLVQRQALAAAQRANVPLIVRSFTSIGTLVGEPIPARHFALAT
jgi:aspartate kinase